MRIGVISDTHDFFDPRINLLFQGVSHILHGGDIGLPRILLELEEIAPVTAVAGNTDDATFNYPETNVIELAGYKFLIHHIVAPHNPSEVVRRAVARHRPNVVVFGHTHKPFSEKLEKILYFNPGYAGKTRFGMERTIALLHCEDKDLRWEYLPLVH